MDKRPRHGEDGDPVALGGDEDMGAGGIDAYFAEVVRRPPMVRVCVEMKARDVAA